MNIRELTLTDWVTDYLESFGRFYAKTTLAKYKAITQCSIRPYFRDTLLTDVDENMVQDFYDSLGEGGKNLSRQTIHLIHSVLKGAFDAAVGMGALPYNPSELAYIKRRIYGNNTVLCDEIIRSVLRKNNKSEYENLFPVMLVSAMRYGEAAALRWDDIDPVRGCIHIHRHLITYNEGGHTHYEIADSTKNRTSRFVYLPPFAFDYFESQRKLQLKERAAAGPAWSNPDNLVFTNETGGPLRYYKVCRRFKKIVTPLGQPYANIHSLRHTGASICFMATRNISSVRAMTGNSGMASASYYIHYIDRERGQAEWQEKSI